MVLSEEEHEEHAYDEREAERMAIYPLAMPLMASPMGIAVLTMVSASKNTTDETLLGLIVVLGAVMLINLAALLLEDKIMHVISPEFLQVAHRILGILLAALAVQSIYTGLVQLGVVAAGAG
jgi:multiple antibiotic resistance protein